MDLYKGRPFVKSSYTDRECVGVATADDVAVGDTKTGYRDVVTVSRGSWDSFLKAVKDGLD